MKTALSVLKKHTKIDPKEQFNIFLSTMIESHQITKTELANRLGVNKQFITKIFNGDRPATVNTAIRIAKVLNEPIEVFVYWCLKSQLARDFEDNDIDVKRIDRVFKKYA
jgi:plasmid maintenance system antidote protein VapI